MVKQPHTKTDAYSFSTYPKYICYFLLNISTHREFNFVSCNIKPNLDGNYTFPIDLAPNGFPFGAKSIDKM